MTNTIDCGGRPLDLSRPAVMGILNVTPDSFSDGGRFLAREQALAQAHAMIAAGADIVDVGGESTRPGSQPVDAAEEMARVIPVIEALVRDTSVPVSVDTSKPEVMRAAAAAGAGMINDVCALRAAGALETAAALGLPVCLMHMLGEPRTMQDAPHYDDVVRNVLGFLRERVDACTAAGMARTTLLVDPGFGFGKTLEHNLDLLRRLNDFRELGLPVLAGLSRKSIIGKAIGLPVEQRLHASVALALIAVQNGANIVRAHDVGPTVEALRMWRAVYPNQ
jgi:dihydropteroate synthase